MGRTRSGGRAARRALREAPDTRMLPHLTSALPPCEPMGPDRVERIDAASMDILEEVGVMFRDPTALEDWRRAGAEVRGEMVFLDRGLVRELIATIPSEIALRARDPAKSVRLGGRDAIFVPMTGAPYLRDLDDVRRAPTLDDLAMFHRLAHVSPALHSTAHHIVEPCDHPISHRHLRITLSSMEASDKTFMGMTTSPRNAEDVMEMCAILFGAETLEREAVTVGNCNGNSPLVWDETMLGAMRAFCRRGQPVLCSPFVLGGANTPASVPATVAQLNAEALSALAYTQVIRRGCPAIYGHYLATVSMRSGAPMAGTPEISMMNLMIGQMARHYGVPWRTSGPLGGAKVLDAQAGYESAATLMATLHAGANYIWHAAGWNEAGMHASVAKFVVDAEQCAMAHRYSAGPRWDDLEAALAAVRDVGPGGHYLGHPHTQGTFETAFFMPECLDNASVEQWQAEGAVETTERALRRARKMLAEYEAPAMDVGTREALRDYVARREREIPAAEALNWTA